MKDEPKQKVPWGWPKDKPFPFPTKEEVEKAIRKGEEMLRRGPEEIKKKSPSVKGRCKVCGGEIVEEFIPVYVDNPVIGEKYPTERVLYCKDCGVVYHHIPEKRIRKK